MKLIRLLMVFFLICCSACAAPVRDVSAPKKGDPYKVIYLVSHGWHAGIVIHHADITAAAWPELRELSAAQYLEIGWGDLNYYQNPDAHLGVVFAAALLPTRSVLHIVGLSDSITEYFPASEIIKVKVSLSGFAALVNSMATSFSLDAAGNVKSLGAGLYGNSQFYLSHESYHLFNTCNVWVARVLHSAGLAIAPVRAIRVEGLMSQVREFGVVIQPRKLED